MNSIYDDGYVSIDINKEYSTVNFALISENTEYNEPGLKNSLEYIKQLWTYIKNKDEKYTFLINLKKENSNVEIPLGGYLLVIQMLIDIYDILSNNCHSVIIVTNNIDKWQEKYNFLTGLWNFEKLRPVNFIEDEKLIDDLISKNQLPL